MNFIDSLREICRKKNSLVCVGLDVAIERLPKHLQEQPNAIFEFNKAIIDATADLVAAYKLNTAFYEAAGAKGWTALKASIGYIPDDTIVIADAKRGDIGNTAKMYAKALFDELGANAITANPLLGQDSALPFLENPQRGVFFLCLTSNPSSADFQRFTNGRKMLFEKIAETVTTWNEMRNCGLVVGATHPEDMALVRRRASALPILIPGIGAQGGDLEKSVMLGTDENAELALFNSSRGIIYKSDGLDFADAARQEASKLKSMLNDARRKKLHQN